MAIYTEKQKKKYEIDCDENGEVLACFVETCTILYKDDVEFSRAHHRDVVELSNVQPIIKELVVKKPEIDAI